MAGCNNSPVLNPIAWYCENSGDTTHAVGSLAANDWRLFDMLGNVQEWCFDRYQESIGTSAVTDPYGPATGTLWILRGGSWMFNAVFARTADRTWGTGAGHATIGFRPVRSLP